MFIALYYRILWERRHTACFEQVARTPMSIIIHGTARMRGHNLYQ